jgi:hypothetical protein
MTRLGWPLAVGLDVCVFLVFSFAGRRSHGEGDALRQVLIVAAPFLGAWLVVALALGVYRSPSLRRVLVAWLVACPLALLLRALGGRGVPLSFDLVAFLFNGVLLVGWRATAARLARP